MRQTGRFATWLASLGDDRARTRILKRLDRAGDGNLGDVASVGDGVSEMRIFYGAGYRIYFVQRGTELIILLCGGDKSTQAADIRQAKVMAKEVE
ncbi:MAG: type II toxin-antitoxin system RelE/ParE family toxin [Sphingomicrobium sp.]